MTSLVTTTRPNLDSPLRYPGGKSSLTEFLRACVSRMPATEVTYVEPYAGGAGAAASLLVRDHVAKIVINDLDPAVHAFWRAILEDGPRLTERIRDVPLTLEEWDRQREVYRSGRSSDWFDLGFAFFFLNRTNRSGVLNAGVIGGRAQSGRYKIGARFNREKLVARIEALNSRADRVELHHLDGRRVIEMHSDDPGVFVYADPPYVKMGSSLYLNSFGERDHNLLASCLRRHRGAWWMLTYDDAPLVRELYADMHLGEYTLHWSARNQGMATELYVLSDPLADALADSAD
jgi:DNA adenine methylase